MRIAITGSRGQLGRALIDAFSDNEVVKIDRPEYDVTSPAIRDKLAELESGLVIHAAAFTDVDGCELDPDTAFRVNGEGTRNVALACQGSEASMVYISTDYVFDGRKGAPYLESEQPKPISVYGESKLAGERYVQELLESYYIVRTAWLYNHGGDNFVEKILQLVQEREELGVVQNEVGSPTYAPDLAAAIAQLTRSPHYGIYHLVNEGACSRFEFAQKILQFAGHDGYPIHPIDEYPRPASPPPYAPLQNSQAAELGITLRPWQKALQAYFRKAQA